MQGAEREDDMKVISLHQPWATLMAYDLKKIETRSWGTNYRGPIAIHATKKQPYFINNTIRQTLDYLNLNMENLPLGAIIAVREEFDCIKIQREIEHVGLPGHELDHGKFERYFGDYTIGRFAWFTRDIKKLKKPIPARGYQGLWTIPDEVIILEEMSINI